MESRIFKHLIENSSLSLLDYRYNPGQNPSVSILEGSEKFKNECCRDVSNHEFLTWLSDSTALFISSGVSDFEYKVRGTYKFYAVVLNSLTDNRFLAVFTDITKYKTTEENLLTLINASPDIICFKDGEGRWLEANETDLGVFSLNGVDYKGKTDLELADYTLPVFKDAFSTCAFSDEKAWEMGCISHLEERIPNGTGSERVFDVVKIPVFSDAEKKERKGLVVIGRDITDVKKAHEIMIRQNALMTSLMNSIPDIVFFKDTKGVFLGCNPAYCDVVGRKPEEIIGLTDYDFFPEAIAEGFSVKDRQMIAEKKLIKYDEWVTKKDGTKILLSTIKTPYFDESGNVIGILGISRDITSIFEQKQRVEELNARLSERVREEVAKNLEYEGLLFNQKKLMDITRMMSSVAHHWRQPLNILGLYIQDIAQRINDNMLDAGTAEEFERDTMDIIQQLSETIDNFSKFFRPNKVNESFEVVSEVFEMIKICEAELSYYGIELSMSCLCGKNAFECKRVGSMPECLSGCSRAIGFKDEFRQVILNIFHNAFDASIKAINDKYIKKGLIKINLDISEDLVNIRIFNRGYKIKDEIADLIFNPYFTTKGDVKGTGIGLFNAKLIIENYMDGRISFRNEKDGVTFLISIPHYCEK